MIFVLATDEKTLLVFPALEDAIAYCEGIDVEAGAWLFWSENGLPLQAEFLAPNQRDGFSVASGVYRLLPAQSGAPLVDLLGGVRSMEPNPFFPSLATVQAHLAGAAPVTQHGA